MWKDYFYFSRSEKRGIIVLVILLVVVLSFRIFSTQSSSLQAQDNKKNDKAAEEYLSFLSTLTDTKRPAKIPKPEEATSAQTIKLSFFDPNKADSSMLISLGMSAKVTRNILRYREKGGEFRKREDLRKIYGLSEDTYLILEPYIQIPSNISHVTAGSKKVDTIRSKETDTIRQIHRDYPQIVKYPTGTMISLNQADTTELMKIPGIGRVTAARIVNYREKLGGFYQISQLAEINLDPENYSQWFEINHKEIMPININNAGLDRLRAHPYINFYQAKAMIEYRKKKGKIKSLTDFKLYEEFNQEDIERLMYYVSYE